MLKLPCQFDKHTGPLATGQHRIQFEIAKEYASVLYEVLQALSSTPNVILQIIPVENQSEVQQALQETEEELWARQNRQIHAKFDEIASLKGIKSNVVKDEIKDKLKKEGKIKTSLKELNINTQFEVIQRLNKVLEPNYE